MGSITSRSKSLDIIFKGEKQGQTVYKQRRCTDQQIEKTVKKQNIHKSFFVQTVFQS